MASGPVYRHPFLVHVVLTPRLQLAVPPLAAPLAGVGAEEVDGVDLDREVGGRCTRLCTPPAAAAALLLLRLLLLLH